MQVHSKHTYLQWSLIKLLLQLVWDKDCAIFLAGLRKDAPLLEHSHHHSSQPTQQPSPHRVELLDLTVRLWVSDSPLEGFLENPTKHICKTGDIVEILAKTMKIIHSCIVLYINRVYKHTQLIVRYSQTASLIGPSDSSENKQLVVAFVGWFGAVAMLCFLPA